MQLLLLGGYSPHNKPWIHEVGRVLAPLVDRSIVHNYAHWDSGGKMDMEAELSAISAEAHELQDYVVFVKSIGIVLTVEAINRGLLAPKACVFAGLPIGAVVERGEAFDMQLADLNCPVTFVQNTNDPVSSFEDVRTYVQRVHPANYTLVELPGNTHDYTDLDEIKSLIDKALNEK